MRHYSSLFTRTKLTFDEIVDDFRENQPHACVGVGCVYLKYGNDGAFYLDGSHLMMHIKGLVFERMKPCRDGRRRRGSKQIRHP